MKGKHLVILLILVLTTTGLWAQATSSLRITGAVAVGEMHNVPDGFPFMQWQHGHLITWDKADAASGRIGIYNSTMQLERAVSFQIEHAHLISIVSADMTKDGELVASGLATQEDGASARFLALISQNGSVTHIVRTEPYLPQYVCAADDGSVYTVGEEWLGPGNVRQTEYPVFRQYRFDKGLTRGIAGRGEFHGTRVSFGGPVHAAILLCDGPAVHLYSDVTRQWFDYDSQKGTLAETDVEPFPGPLAFVTGMVVTGSGRVLVGIQNPEAPSQNRIFELTPPKASTDARRHWVPVPGTECPTGGPCILSVLRIEKNELVLEEGYAGLPTLYRAALQER